MHSSALVSYDITTKIKAFTYTGYKTLSSWQLPEIRTNTSQRRRRFICKIWKFCTLFTSKRLPRFSAPTSAHSSSPFWRHRLDTVIRASETASGLRKTQFGNPQRVFRSSFGDHMLAEQNQRDSYYYYYYFQLRRGRG